jgi:glycosidase
MLGGGDPDNRRDFPGGFPGDTQNAFSAKGRTPVQAEMFNHVRTLLKLRRDLEPLRRGDLEVVHVSRDALAFVRRVNSHCALVAVNNGVQPLDLTLSADVLGMTPNSTLRERFPASSNLKPQGGRFNFVVGARSSAVFSQ